MFPAGAVLRGIPLGVDESAKAPARLSGGGEGMDGIELEADDVLSSDL